MAKAAKTKATPVAPPGAVAQEVKITKPKPADGPVMVEIVTTRVGTFDAGGHVPVGTQASIAVTAFSRAWMKPANKASLEIIREYLASK